MMINNLMKCVLFVCLLNSYSIIAFGQIDKAELELKNMMNDLDVVGLSVAVVKGGEMFYTKSFGLKDLNTKEPLNDSTLFRIASISKSFSATAIMQLVEAGKLSLKDDFSKLMGFKVRNPKFPDKIITLKMVLSHTSSINDKEGYFNFDVINPDKNKNWANCYNDYEPGKVYQYCNLNFNMVGAVIEKQSGERFDNYIKNHILKPLDLYGGYCVDSLNKDRFATLYEFDAKNKQYSPSPMAYNPRKEELKNYIMGYSTPIFSPTGGMKISAIDLAKYMTMHMFKGTYKGTKIISKSSSRTMQAKLSEEEGYGLAIRTVTNLIPNVLMKGHTGSAYGLYSAMFFQPDDKFGVVVITNGCNVTSDDDINEVLKRSINILYSTLIK